MRANELRIGNYVKANKLACNEKEGNTLTVCGIGLDVDLTNGTTQNYIGIDGILLTKEWLLKFGFEKWGFGNQHKVENETYIRYVLYNVLDGTSNFEVHYIVSDDKKYNQYIISCDEDERVNWGADILHVHQLQNLYFALTNQELTIN